MIDGDFKLLSKISQSADFDFVLVIFNFIFLTKEMSSNQNSHFLIMCFFTIEQLKEFYYKIP